MSTKKPTRAEWLKRVRQWKSSGKSRVAFAREQPYSESALGWWSRKLAAEGESLEVRTENSAGAFVELTVSHPERSSALRMRAGSFEVVVERDFDREALVRLLEVLESRS